MKLIGDIEHHKSYSYKKANDFKWAKDVFDVYDARMGQSADEIRRMDIKYHLSEGLLPRLNKRDWNILDIKFNPQAAKKDWQKIPHEPIINTLFGLIVGERQRQVFEPIAKDLGLFSRSEKNRLHLMYLQNYLEKTVWEPFKSEITQKYMMETGTESPLELSHDDQQQMMSDINQRLMEMTPDKINEYFDKEYYSPYSEQAQMLLDFESKSKDLKHHFEERFKHGYISNTEISYIYESYGLPRIDLCNPRGFSWEGPDDCNFIEDGMRAKYEVYRDPMDIVHRYGNSLKMSDIEKLESGHYYDGNGYNKMQYYRSMNTPEMDSKIVGWYSENHKEMFPNGFDQNTPEGQQILLAMKAKFFNNANTAAGAKIRDCHIVFRTPVEMKQIGRMVNNRREYSWHHSDYVFNPDEGDFSERVMRSTEIWGVRMLGWANQGVCVEAGPLKYQWADIEDPQNKKLPYHGIFYNKLMSNAPARGGFDKGVPYQIKFNIQSAILEEEKGHNIGKVFLMFLSAKPKEYEMDEWLDMIKYNRTIVIDETNLTGAAAVMATAGHAFKSIDLSNTVGIMDAMQQLEAIYRMMMRAMSVNPEREGSSSPYMSIQNNKQNLINSSNKTLDIYTTHNLGINRTLQSYMDFCHYVYSKNPRPLQWIMNDMSIAELRLSDEFLKYGKVGVFYGNDPEDQDAMGQAKTNMMHFIQADRPDLVEPMIRILFAKTPSDMLNVAARLRKVVEERNKQAEEIRKQEIAQQMEMSQQDKLQDQAHELRMQQLLTDNKLEIEAIRDGGEFDINDDNINDLNQQSDKKIAADSREKEKDRRLQMTLAERDARLKMALAQKQLEAARIKTPIGKPKKK